MTDPHAPYLWLYGRAFAEGSDMWCRLAWRAAQGDELAQIACLEEIADRTGVPADLEQSVQRATEILGG